MGDVLDPRDVERARSFWAEQDVGQVFSRVFEYLGHLQQALQGKTATDEEYVQAKRLLDCLDRCAPPSSPPDQDLSVVKVVIGSGGLLPAPRLPPAAREKLLPPLAPVQLKYHPHPCCKACLPRTPESSSLLYGQNPLKVPLLCGFKRLSGVPLLSPTGTEDDGDWDVIYKAPCGQSLRSFQDVMCFLLATESLDILQVDFFTFNPVVKLDPSPALVRTRQDLSRGAEPTPVELCVGDGQARPAHFRYRKDRWPHGCFLSRDAPLFLVCCDCVDGCVDAEHCACVAMTPGGRGYTHQRLPEPVQSGLWECGPWCGCHRARCQNRLVQRGVRVRLQVFETKERGWGVRCRDDLDIGTFVCIYAGVVLQRAQSPEEPSPPKLTRAEPPSDDEVEVVTEWLAPPILEARRDPPALPPAATQHIPVIQRPGDSEVRKKKDGGTSLMRVAETDGVVIDATKEGNVSRFFNHSCQPNLFLQNVFTDSHDPAFSVIAFFTSRVVKAGTELTWNYSADVHAPASGGRQEVPCLCRSNGCQGWLHLEEDLCGVCEADGEAAMKSKRPRLHFDPDF